MITYGNQIWNKAVSNDEKSVILMKRNAFDNVQHLLENSGLNYFAYEKNDSVVMGINTKDINWFKNIVGSPIADKMRVQNPVKPYSPPNKNIIGNTEYRYIPQKSYFSADTDTALKLAQMMKNENIQFSGRVYGSNTKLTVSAQDLPKLKEFNDKLIKMRANIIPQPNVHKEIIGSVPYSNIKKKYFYFPRISPARYNEIKPKLEKFDLHYSGIIKDNRVIFTIEETQIKEFFAKLNMAINENIIDKDLHNLKFSDNQMNILSEAVTLASEKDILGLIERYVEPSFSDEQLASMSNKLISYLNQPDFERMYDKNGILEDLINEKSAIDNDMIFNDFIKEHNSYSPEQLEILRNAFENGITLSTLETLDDSYSINEINDLISALEAYDADEFERIVADHVNDNLEKDKNVAKNSQPTFESPKKTDTEKTNQPNVANIKTESPKKPFTQQVDDVIAGKANRYDDLKVCDTPQILLNIGCKSLPMMYTQNHLRNALKPKDGHSHTHGLSIDAIKEMPNLLAQPVMIMDSLTQKDSLVIITSRRDNDNMPIVATVKPNGKGKYEMVSQESNFITSIYGRDKFQKFIERNIDNNTILYADKIKSQELFSVLGLQSSKGLNNLDYDIIIHQSKNIVNTISTESEKNFSQTNGENEKAKTVKEQENVEPTNDSFEKTEPPQKPFTQQKAESPVEQTTDLRNYSFFEKDNKILFKKADTVCDFRFDNKNSTHKRVKAFIELRDCTRDLLAAQEQDKSDSEIVALQGKLNTLYDSFNKDFGLLHSRTNKSLLSEDISYSLVSALEKKVDKNKLVEKSDLFSKRTIKPAKAVTHVDTAIDALALSIAEKAKVDLEYMEALTDLPEEILLDELHGEVYPVPGTENEYQSASEYLSGDIRCKLNAAEIALSNDVRMQENINALHGAMPEPLKAADIEIKIGATWFDKKIYQQFIYETFDTPDFNREDGKKSFWRKSKDISVDYSEHTSAWHIDNKTADNSVKATKEFGTNRANAYQIMEDLLNLKEPKLYMTKVINGDEKRVLDIEATKLAQRKADNIKSAFKDWIFEDPNRRTQLVDKYNELFNSIKPSEYDGSKLRFPCMNADIQLHEHQKNAIAHSLFGGNTLFAHSVGAGKTYEMIASAMESKRLGLCTKSLFAVPNHLTEQIGDDFRKLYPNANILVATKADFKKENRQSLFSKIASENFDAVIIGHSQLSMIKMSKERQENILNNQINDIIEGIKELKSKDGNSFQVKAMERTKKSLVKRLDNLKKDNQDDIITFEQLGVDKLFVDEAHEFKNLFTPTKLQNVSGISSSASQKALDLFMKCQYLDEKTGGKGIVFATGTPLSNSVTELHTMMRYLEYDFLKSKNLQHFDNWVTTFGNQKTDWELAPAGNKFKQRTRIANYTGLPELVSMFKQVADVRTADTLNLDVPQCEMHIVNAEPTEFQKKLVEELATRADDVQGGNVQPDIDNMLKITSDGRKLGLDPRLINPDFEDNPNTKLNQCVNNVFKIYEDTYANKSTQIIFCDLGVPHGADKAAAKENEKGDGIEEEKSVSENDSLEEECDFCIYDDIKAKLIEKGIPENQIAFIHSAKTEAAKTDLFEKVRSGDVRVLIGSTGKMGTGTNVQDKLIAVHDLDIPWRPADMEQRKGRIVRQGNENKNVHVFRYVTKGTFDAYSYQTLENKQKFISQIMTSKVPVRKCDDVDQQSLSYSEIKALCTGDERIKEKMSLDNEVKELRLLKSEYKNTQYEMQDKIKNFPAKKSQYNDMLKNLNKDLEHCKTLPIDSETHLPKFAIDIDNVHYTDRTIAAKALESTCLKLITKSNESFNVGNFHGFPLSVYYDGTLKEIKATLSGATKYSSDFGISFSANIKKLESSLYHIESRIDDVTTNLNKAEIDINEAKKILQQPFMHDNELSCKEQRLIELTDQLNEAAAQAKLNNPNNERTHFFDTAKLKKDSVQRGTQKKTPNKDKSLSNSNSQDDID